jgi:hypothetical protein
MEYRTMTINAIYRLARVIRSKSKTSFAAFRKLSGAHLKLALLAAGLFALAYAAESKAIISLESSQDLFEVIPNQLLYR